MIRDIYKKTHEVTVKGIKKVVHTAKAVAGKEEKKITLGDILMKYPKGKVFVVDSNDKPIYDFNMDNCNVLFKNFDKEVEIIETAMFPDVKTGTSAVVLAIKLK